ncbi:MAG: PAS domain-containing protein [Dehalococcoidia bacterium]|nr:PAS domain-containing protein [Dehalococcoidia bacterium]
MNQPLRVLIIEDSEDDALLLLRELRKGGYEPSYTRVQTADEMKTALEAQQWDIVLSDYVMPGFSGLKALGILREKGLDVPFVIVSGQIGEDIAVEAMKAGAHDYIVKGSLKRLVPAIARELGEAESRRERRRVEKALRRSEASLAEAQRIAHLANWEWDIIANVLWYSDEIHRIFGLTQSQIPATFEAGLDHVHPEHRPRVRQAITEALQSSTGYGLDYRFVRPDGTEGVVHAEGEVTFDDDGKPIRMVGTTQDVTERKRLEERLRALSRRLIQVQEEERRTIGRELHDQIGQSLTVVKLLIDNAIKAPAGRVKKILNEAETVTHEVITQLRDLSSELRPSMLDDLGLLPTLIWHIGRLGSRSGLEIDFKHSGLNRQFPPEIATAAYRIMQEALTNVIRHSGADQAIVRVWAEESKLVVWVEDHGRGFDPSARHFQNTIGLSSMEERALLLDGTLIIETSPGNGTLITAELPLVEPPGNREAGNEKDHADTSR